MLKQINCWAMMALAIGMGTGRVFGASNVRGGRLELVFDKDWLFLKGDCQKGEANEFDDSAWRTLDVPHDWSIEGPFDQNAPSTGAGAFLPDGVGWYRKHFTTPAGSERKRTFIDFDGVMANSDVWINGFHLGKRPYGYVSFRYELTGHLNAEAGGENVIAVRADNSQQPASRWYSGAGIYRHVHLLVMDPVHLEQDGTFVTTPQITPEHATVHVRNTVVNQLTAAKDVTVRVTLLDEAGKEAGSVESVSKSVPPGASVAFEQDISLMPQLWDLDHPHLYRACQRCEFWRCDDRSGHGILRNTKCRVQTRNRFLAQRKKLQAQRRLPASGNGRPRRRRADQRVGASAGRAQGHRLQRHSHGTLSAVA